MDDEIEKFVTERDEMLLSMDIERMRMFHRRYNPDIPPPDDDEVALVTMHKARSGARTLPESEQKLSRDWLTARGYRHLGEPEKGD